MLLPGASGSGKSTLVAGLVRAGLGYLTDELAALNMATGRLVPYAKPITVKPGSFAVLADMGPDVGLESGHGPWAGQEWQVAVGDGTGRRIGRPCVPRLRRRAPLRRRRRAPALTPLSDTEAFFALAVNAVNLIPHGSEGTRALGRLATGVPVLLADHVGPRRGLPPGLGSGGADGRRAGSAGSAGSAGVRRPCDPEWPDGRSRPHAQGRCRRGGTGRQRGPLRRGRPAPDHAQLERGRRLGLLRRHDDPRRHGARARRGAPGRCGRPSRHRRGRAAHGAQARRARDWWPRRGPAELPLR